jgi:hypothetical protein
MRRLATAFLGLTLAVPASAQIAPRHDYGDVRMPDRLGGDGREARPSVGREARAIRSDIDRLRSSRAISRQDAQQLSREARAIERNGGSLSPSAAVSVQAQLLALRSQVQAAQARRNRRR